jgi:hypothetical protein
VLFGDVTIPNPEVTALLIQLYGRSCGLDVISDAIQTPFREIPGITVVGEHARRVGAFLRNWKVVS